MPDLTPNPAQIKSAVGVLLAAFGGFVGGIGVSKGWYTVDQLGQFLNSETVIATITTLVIGAWRIWTHTDANAIAAVEAIPAVKGVVTQPTIAGQDLAAAIPKNTVAAAGTDAARAIASPTPNPQFTHVGPP